MAENPQVTAAPALEAESAGGSGKSIATTAWATIAEAGGIHAWVHKELLRLGLIDESDPSKRPESEKKAYKARRDEERRIRRELFKTAWSAYKKAHLVHLGLGIFH